MTPHCQHDPPNLPPPGEPYSTDHCRFCWLAEHNSAYAAWRVAPKSPCRHKGAEVRRQQCATCRGKVELKVFACAVHGECTAGKRAEGVKGCCEGCREYVAADPFGGREPIRNLLYYVYPVAGNGVWRRDVGMLLRRIGLFNGRRVVAVATGPGCDPSRQVRDLFAGRVHEFIEIRNDPAIREGAAFEEMFARVETTGPRHVTLFAHAKGVSRPPLDNLTAWVDMIHETYLDYWPFVERTLREYPVAGSFLRLIQGWPAHESRSDWHYSGSWCWFRNAALFGRPDWRRIDRFYGGVESYWSLHFRREEAGLLFHSWDFPGAGMYDPAYVNGVVMPVLARWRAGRAADRKEYAPC